MPSDLTEDYASARPAGRLTARQSRDLLALALLVLGVVGLEAVLVTVDIRAALATLCGVMVMAGLALGIER